MRRILVFILPVFLYCHPVLALDISGYYETRIDGQTNANYFFLTNYNRLRIDLKSEIDKDIIFKANFIVQTFHGKTEFNISDFIPEKFHLAVKDFPPFEFKDEIFIDNIFITIRFPFINLTAGKQQLPFGTGYVWNPTSVFHTKSILEPTYELSGVNALLLDIPFNESNLTFIFAPAERWNLSDKALRLKKHISGFDLSVSVINKGEEKRLLYGGDFVGELLGLGVWGEMGWNKAPLADYIQFVCGFDWTFEFQTHIMAEYYYNEDGRDSHRKYTFADWMRLLSGERTNLGRDYIFLRASHPVTDLMEMGSFTLINLNDESFVIVPEMIYNLTENTDITIMLNLFSGKDSTEYGEFPSGGFIRLRAYF